jgi:hypothetical protein
MQYISNRIIVPLTLGVMAIVLIAVLKLAYASSPPLVETGDFSLHQDKAILMGTVIDSGGQDISQYGFVWGTSPDLENAETVDVPMDAESFEMEIGALREGTTYYYQAFARNSKGYGFGEIKSLVVPENLAPTIDIISPADGLKVTQGEAVSFAATGKDDREVAGITLEINGSVHQEAQSSSIDYKWDTGSVEPGTYEIKVTATDGYKTTEKIIMVEVQPKPVQSTPVVTQPAANTETVSRGTTPHYTPAYNSNYPKLSKVNGCFGQFRYRDTYGGRIEIDPQWVKENIVTITLPGINRQVQVHKDAAGAFIKAFTYIQNGTAVINGKTVPLTSLVRTMDGTWVPRHIGWNPSRNLSNHSWGTAIDINASDHYRYVDPAKEPHDPNLILWEKAFKPAGFSWGNRYGDAMHYELLW